MRRFTATLGSVALVWLVGCAGETACTAIGAPPTVTVDVAKILARRDVPMRVTVCVGSRCRTAPRRTEVRDGSVRVNDPTIENEGPVEVSLVVATHAGGVVYRETASVPLERMQPNGPGCDPVTYAVALDATDEGLVPM